MKKILALLLASVMMLSLVGTAMADTLTTTATTTTAEAKYTLTDVKYDGKNVTGRVIHVDGTAVVEKISVRITFFIFNNYYMATSQTVRADGTFSITGVGPIEYITVLARAVTEDGYSRLDAAAIELGK